MLVQPGWGLCFHALWACLLPLRPIAPVALRNPNIWVWQATSKKNFSLQHSQISLSNCQDFVLENSICLKVDRYTIHIMYIKLDHMWTLLSLFQSCPTKNYRSKTYTLKSSEPLRSVQFICGHASQKKLPNWYPNPYDPCLVCLPASNYHQNQPNVGKNTIHGSSGELELVSRLPRYQLTLPLGADGPFRFLA